MHQIFIVSFIKARNGVVIATEKKLPILMDSTSVQKVTLLTPSIHHIVPSTSDYYNPNNRIPQLLTLQRLLIYYHQLPCLPLRHHNIA
jgi:hypothetical protein